jgi:hypothetical protein
MSCPYCEECDGKELGMCVKHFNCVGIIKHRKLFAVKGKFTRFTASRVFEKRVNTILGILEQEVDDTVVRKLLLNMDGELIEAVSCVISGAANLDKTLEAAEDAAKNGVISEQLYNNLAKLLMTASNLRKNISYTDYDVT